MRSAVFTIVEIVQARGYVLDISSESSDSAGVDVLSSVSGILPAPVLWLNMRRTIRAVSWLLNPGYGHKRDASNICWNFYILIG